MRDEPGNLLIAAIAYVAANIEHADRRAHGSDQRHRQRNEQPHRARSAPQPLSSYTHTRYRSRGAAALPISPSENFKPHGHFAAQCEATQVKRASKKSTTKLLPHERNFFATTGF
jgi:hypothetical protein